MSEIEDDSHACYENNEDDDKDVGLSAVWDEESIQRIRKRGFLILHQAASPDRDPENAEVVFKIMDNSAAETLQNQLNASPPPNMKLWHLFRDDVFKEYDDDAFLVKWYEAVLGVATPISESLPHYGWPGELGK